MSHFELCEGSIEAILKGESLDKPVLQVLNVHKIAIGVSENQDNYRLILSDGIHSHPCALIATRGVTNIKNGDISNFSLVRLSKYVTHNSHPGRVLVVVFDIEIVSRGSLVQKIIGNPISYDLKELDSSKYGSEEVSNSNISNDILHEYVGSDSNTNQMVKQFMEMCLADFYKYDEQDKLLHPYQEKESICYENCKKTSTPLKENHSCQSSSINNSSMSDHFVSFNSTMVNKSKAFEVDSDAQLKREVLLLEKENLQVQIKLNQQKLEEAPLRMRELKESMRVLKLQSEVLRIERQVRCFEVAHYKSIMRK